MDYDKGAFLSELEESNVQGIVVIEANDDSDQYRVAEKWDPSDDPNYTIEGERWSTYWVSADAMAERVEEGAVEYKQQLSNKQFRGILNLAGVEDDRAEAVA